LGTHWNFLLDHAIQFSWAKLDRFDSYMSDESILAVKQKSKSMARQNPWSAKNQILLSEDFFKNYKVILTGGNTFALTTDYMYAGRVDREGNRKLVMATRAE